MADKTGTGNYGTINDIAIAWPPRSDPLVIALMSRRAAADAEPDEALLAQAAAFVAATVA